MLKRPITYEDFNGNTVTDVFYFNLSKPEIIELEAEHEGVQQLLENIIESKDNKQIVEWFKKIIMLSYGEKSADGKRFIKSDKLREEFAQTAAFQQLFMEMATDEGVAAEFIKGAFPKDMSGKAGEVIKSMPTPPNPVQSV